MCHDAGAIVKVILETAFLDDAAEDHGLRPGASAGADFVKTSTGFGPAGATVQDIVLMRHAVGPAMGVKAAGGIRTLDDFRAMVAAGANRVGASASVKIVEAAAPECNASSKTVRFRERSELLDFLLEVSTVTSQTLDLDQLLANVSEIVQRVIPGRAAGHPALQREAPRAAHPLRAGHREEVVQNWSIPLGQGITGTAALTREPVLVNDVRSDPRYLNAVEAVRTELAVPMIARRKLVGVIDMQSTRPNAYTEQDRALLRLIAGARGHFHRQRAALLACRPAESHAEGADRHLAGVLVDPGRG